MGNYHCPTCGSPDYMSNGVDGYICCDCSSQFFVVNQIPPDGLCDNEIYDPEAGKDENLCPTCRHPLDDELTAKLGQCIHCGNPIPDELEWDDDDCCM